MQPVRYHCGTTIDSTARYGHDVVQRLDTFWRYDMPERLEIVVLGDTISSGGGWSRPARYGGIRWGRAFSLRPGFVTLPQLSLAGQAALPSIVDVLINNQALSARYVDYYVTVVGAAPVSMATLIGLEAASHNSIQ